MTIQTMQVGPIGTNCYFIPTLEEGCVLVDPGDDGNRLVEWVKKSDTTLVAILITHGHWDHISGVDTLLTAFPEAKIYMNPAELPIVEWSRNIMTHKESADLVIEKSIPLKNGEKLHIQGLDFTVIFTPGHSQGGVVFLLDGNMFSGDTLFYKEIGRCDLVSGDYQVMLGTLKKLVNLEGDYKVYPGHEQNTTLDFERHNNPYMKQAL